MRLYWKPGSMLWVVLEDWWSILDCNRKNGWSIALVVLEAWMSIRLYWKSVTVHWKTGSMLWVVLEASKNILVHWKTERIVLDALEIQSVL